MLSIFHQSEYNATIVLKSNNQGDFIEMEGYSQWGEKIYSLSYHNLPFTHSMVYASRIYVDDRIFYT